MTDPANDRSDRDNEGEHTETLSAPGGEESSASANVSDSDTQTEQDTRRDGDTSASSSETLSLVDAQNQAEEAAKALLDHKFEGIIKAETSDGDGWRTVVEVVERSAVPNTQDIIGRYEIMLDATGEVTGYELVERYRRNDMKEEL